MKYRAKIMLSIFALLTAVLALPTNHNSSFAAVKSVQDELFGTTAMTFNPHLAKFCLDLSTSAYGNTSENAEMRLSELGFTNDGVYDAKSYEKNAQLNSNSVGYSFGSKPLKGSPYTLIAVVIRGTSGDNEWISNFNINNSGDSPNIHEGFSKAEKSLHTNLEAYVKSLNLDKSTTKFVITGHSRGAAVANLLAADLSESETLADQSNIYAYTFATPNVAKLGESNYLNIFNAVNEVDMVTQIPLSTWGYDKYGVSYSLPSENLINSSDLEVTRKFLNEITKTAPTLKDFYESNVSFLFLHDDNIPAETAAAHKIEKYAEWMNAANPDELLRRVSDLQLEFIGDDNYA